MMKNGDSKKYLDQIDVLPGVGAQTAQSLTELLKIEDRTARIIDLLFRLPISNIDRSNCPSNAELFEYIDEIVTIDITVISYQGRMSRGYGKRAMGPLRVQCICGDQLVTIVYFAGATDWIKARLPLNSRRIVSGKLELRGKSLQISHPDFIVEPHNSTSLPMLEPIYLQSADVSRAQIRRHVKAALDHVQDCSLLEWIDHKLIAHRNWNNFYTSIASLHQLAAPEDLEPNSPGRERLAFDELLSHQIKIELVRRTMSVRNEAAALRVDSTALRNKALEEFGFTLTNSQQSAVSQLIEELSADHRSLQLLQGDVGSGKTIVALLAMLHAVANGKQAALMAPTELLAKQHARVISQLAEQINVRTELLTGAIKAKQRAQILNDIASGECQIIIGTHALFQASVEYKNLSFIVIDEQHRFGVHQRTALSDKATEANILLMTATPIPRTMVLAAFGNISHLTLSEKPKSRKTTQTRAIPNSKTDMLIERLRTTIDASHRVYWVCASLEQTTDDTVTTAIDRQALLETALGIKVGLVHGQMKAADRDAEMARFVAGEINIIVATTVIEVGVDVAEARTIIIENAERFGLAQLHQLRGRVGRNDDQNYCILLYNDPLDEISRTRLEVIRTTTDGFKIAAEDLTQRGGGEVLGRRQSGSAGFQIADLYYHSDLIAIANQQARSLLVGLTPGTESSAEQRRSSRAKIEALLALFDRENAKNIANNGLV